MQIRLQKYLADCGIASRRACEELISAGRISVNGQTAQIGAKIMLDDIVFMDGAAVALKSENIYIALHKPKGVITSVKDQFGRKTVIDFVSGIDARLYPIGRLDYGTSGLILLTNDGELAQKLTHPRHSIAKIYTAKLSKPLDALHVKAFAEGITIDGYTTRPASLEILGNGYAAKIILKEGRNRQIRKMFEALEVGVVSLKRIAIGHIKLGELPVGKYRHLTAEEISGLN